MPDRFSGHRNWRELRYICTSSTTDNGTYGSILVLDVPRGVSFSTGNNLKEVTQTIAIQATDEWDALYPNLYVYQSPRSLLSGGTFYFIIEQVPNEDQEQVLNILHELSSNSFDSIFDHLPCLIGAKIPKKVIEKLVDKLPTSVDYMCYNFILPDGVCNVVVHRN